MPFTPKGQETSRSRILEITDARKVFGGLVAVFDVSFHIETGQIVALIGPNGAGKSTLFDLISGVQRITSGEIKYQGKLISGTSAREIARSGMARTFQHVKLLDDRSVLENVLLGAHMKGKVGSVASALGLNRHEEDVLEKAAMLPIQECDLAHLALTPAGSLALGQQRIVEVARALANEPKLLLLDEPAAGLRLGEKTALRKLILSLRQQGVSVLLVEHDMDFVMGLADKIVVMENGVKIAEGTPREIQSNARVIQAYLGDAA